MCIRDRVIIRWWWVSLWTQMVCRETLEILKVYDAGKYFWNPAKLENIRFPKILACIINWKCGPIFSGLGIPNTLGCIINFWKLLDFSTNPGHLWPMWVMWATFSPIDAFFLLFRCFVSAERPRWSPVFAPKTSSQRVLWRPGSLRTLEKLAIWAIWAILSPCKIPREIRTLIR